MAAAAFCPAASVWGPQSCSPLGGAAQSRRRPPSPKAGHVGFCQKTDFVPEKSSWIFSWRWRPSWRQELVRTQAGAQQGCGAPSQRARCGEQRGVARRRGVCNRVSRKAREGRAGAEAARRPCADPCPRAHDLPVRFVALPEASGRDHAPASSAHTHPALSAASAAAPGLPRKTCDRGAWQQRHLASPGTHATPGTVRGAR